MKLKRKMCFHLKRAPQRSQSLQVDSKSTSLISKNQNAESLWKGTRWLKCAFLKPKAEAEAMWLDEQKPRNIFKISFVMDS